MYNPLDIVCFQTPVLHIFSKKKLKYFENDSIPSFRSCILQNAVDTEEIQSVITQLSTPANKEGDGMFKSGFCRWVRFLEVL